MQRPFYTLPRERKRPAAEGPAAVGLRTFSAPDAPAAVAATLAATPEYPFSDLLFWHVEVHRLVDLSRPDEGLVLVRVRLDRAGTLLDAHIEQGSGRPSDTP